MELIKKRILTVSTLVITLCLNIFFSQNSKAQDLPEAIPVIFGVKTINPVAFDDLTGLPIELTENDSVSYSFQVILPDTTNISSLKISLGTALDLADVYESEEDYSSYTDSAVSLFRNGALLRNRSLLLSYKKSLHYEFSIYDLSGNCSYKSIGTFND